MDRIPDPARPNLVEQTAVTSPISVRFEVEDGVVKNLQSFALASEPRHKVMDAVMKGTTAYNLLVEGTEHRQLLFKPRKGTARAAQR